MTISTAGTSVVEVGEATTESVELSVVGMVGVDMRLSFVSGPVNLSTSAGANWVPFSGVNTPRSDSPDPKSGSVEVPMEELDD